MKVDRRADTVLTTASNAIILHMIVSGQYMVYHSAREVLIHRQP